MICVARGAGSVMSMAFPTILAAVQPEWDLSYQAAGSISAASQAGCLALSLVLFRHHVPGAAPVPALSRFSLDTGLGRNRAGRFMVEARRLAGLAIWAGTPPSRLSYRRRSLEAR